ncbi:MAG: glycosyltransferase family 4 protein [Bacteroidota bacterium]
MKPVLGYICGNDSWGGLEMNQLRNAQWMQLRGHQVFMLCLQGSIMEKNAIEIGVAVVHIEKHRKYYDFLKGRKLVKIIQNHSISHLIVRATHDMSIAAFAKRTLKKKLHLSYFTEMQFGVKKTNILHTLRFRNFDLWSCPLNFLADQVRTMTHFSHDKIVVIPSGLELIHFQHDIDKSGARTQLNLPLNTVIFGLIGRFDAHKGQLLLLEAMKQCKRNDFSIVFLGEPTRNEGDDYFQQMKQFIDENELVNRVYILPFRKDIEVFYKAIDWFVMASKAETFGMVTIEALACGTPTLGSNAGGTPELLRQGDLGVLFEPLNSSDLALKIDEILDENHSISKESLLEEAKRFDHNLICSAVEKALNLN